MNSSVRQTWIDSARGIMMFLVYFYHSEVIVGDAHKWSWWFAPFFLTGFFFLSGYLYTSDIHKVNLRAKCKQIFRSILIPYLVFTGAMFLPKVLLNHFDARQQFIDILMFRASWFVVVIGVLQFTYALLIRIRSSFSFLSVATGLLFVTGYVLKCSYGDFLVFVGDNAFIQSSELPNRLPFCFNIALMMCPFFLLGMLYRRFEKDMRLSDSWLQVGGLAILYVVLMKLDNLFLHSGIVVVVNEYDNILLVFGYAILGITAVMMLSRKIGGVFPLLDYVGRNSLLFYFLNAAALRTTKYVGGRFSEICGGGYWWVFGHACAAVLITIPVVWVINRYFPILSGRKEAYEKLSRRLKLNIEW